jgi:hypothetical protein
VAAAGPGRVLSEHTRARAAGLGGTVVVLGIILGYLVLLPWIADELDEPRRPARPTAVAVLTPGTPAREVSLSVPEGWGVDRSRAGDVQSTYIVDADVEVWLTVTAAPPGADRIENALAEERRVVEESGRVRFTEPVVVPGPAGLTGRVAKYTNPVAQGLIGAWAGDSRLVRVRAGWAGVRDEPAEAVLALVRSLGQAR